MIDEKALIGGETLPGLIRLYFSPSMPKYLTALL